jgi:hypothetical protein
LKQQCGPISRSKKAAWAGAEVWHRILTAIERLPAQKTAGIGNEKAPPPVGRERGQAGVGCHATRQPFGARPPCPEYRDYDEALLDLGAMLRSFQAKGPAEGEGVH